MICLQRLVAHIVSVLFVDSVFFDLSDRTFQWNYAFLIVLEDVHIHVFITTFSQYLLSINEESYPDCVLTIKSVFYLSFFFCVIFFNGQNFEIQTIR